MSVDETICLVTEIGGVGPFFRVGKIWVNLYLQENTAERPVAPISDLQGTASTQCRRLDSLSRCPGSQRTRRGAGSTNVIRRGQKSISIPPSAPLQVGECCSTGRSTSAGV